MIPQQLLSAARSGTTFSILEFIRQPVVLLRLGAVLVAIIVFGTISSGGHLATDVCIYNGESSACSFPVAVGVFAFLGSILFMISDAMFDKISNLKKRKMIIIGDLAFSGLWCFLWFICFCLMANKWAHTTYEWLTQHSAEGWQENNARSAIVFSFVSILIWGGITFFALRRFRSGQSGLGMGADVISEPGAESSHVPGQTYTGVSDSAGGQQSYTTGAVPQAPMSGGTGGGQYYGPTY